MVRPWRIKYEGALYYVFSRGNNQGERLTINDLKQIIKIKESLYGLNEF